MIIPCDPKVLIDSDATRFHGQPGEGETYASEKRDLAPFVFEYAGRALTAKQLMDLLVTVFWIGKED